MCSDPVDNSILYIFYKKKFRSIQHLFTKILNCFWDIDVFVKKTLYNRNLKNH